MGTAEHEAFWFRDYRPQTVRNLPKAINDKYHFDKAIGFGAFGTVYLAHEYRTCAKYAIKCMKKKSLINDKQYTNEANIMKALTHPCILKMYDIYNDFDTVYLILELMHSDLNSRIQEEGFLPENVSQCFFYQICHALKHLHAQNVTHRDLKPDNCLLASANDITLLKLSDFGISKLVRENSALRTKCGSLSYVFML